MSHAIIRTDKMHGTYNAGSLVNVKLHAALDNGCVVKLGAMASGEREAYLSEVTTAKTPLSQVAIIAEPEVMYDERLSDLGDFTNKAGDIVRAFMLHPGDEFGLTKEGFEGSPTVGHVVELSSANKMKDKGDGSPTGSGTTLVGTIVAKEGDFFVVRVG